MSETFRELYNTNSSTLHRILRLEGTSRDHRDQPWWAFLTVQLVTDLPFAAVNTEPTFNLTQITFKMTNATDLIWGDTARLQIYILLKLKGPLPYIPKTVISCDLPADLLIYVLSLKTKIRDLAKSTVVYNYLACFNRNTQGTGCGCNLASRWQGAGNFQLKKQCALQPATL